MGVKDLWSILEPVAESCSLADLHGKCLAVDISTWIFQSKEALTGKEAIHPHLRILFWRLYHLMKNNVQLVVVFDGACPDVKTEAVSKRRSKTVSLANFPGVSQFQKWTDECKELLSVFRIPYLISEGDAEALCAQLNQNGIVDGCITEDSDAFLFGARNVYRHFNCDSHRIKSLTCYRMDAIREKLNLSREHMVSMALLLGCDYGLGGVRGVGKEHAMRLMRLWENANPLEKMTQWRQECKSEKTVSRLMKPDRKPAHCRLCGHIGSSVEHCVTGCDMCGQNVGCTKSSLSSSERVCRCRWHLDAELQQSSQLEAKVKQAALKDPHFPSNELIEQYQTQDTSRNIVPDWQKPSYQEIEKYLLRLFKWDRKKIKDVMTGYFAAYDMGTLVRSSMSGDSFPEGFSRPNKILALKRENGREIYVVEWKSISGVPTINDEKMTTKEFKDNFSAAYPQVAASYEGWLSRNSTPTKSPSRKRGQPDTPQGKQMSIERYCVARKRLFFPLPAVSKDD